MAFHAFFLPPYVVEVFKLCLFWPKGSGLALGKKIPRGMRRKVCV